MKNNIKVAWLINIATIVVLSDIFVLYWYVSTMIEQVLRKKFLIELINALVLFNLELRSDMNLFAMWTHDLIPKTNLTTTSKLWEDTIMNNAMVRISWWL